MSNKNPTILERLDMVEKATDQLWKLFEGNFGEVRKTLAAFTETLTAVIKAGGPDYEVRVGEELKKVRTDRYEAELKRSKVVLDQLLDNKVLEATGVITEDSVVTGRYLDSTTGELAEPGYSQFEFKYFTPEAKASLLGQGPGFVYKTENTKAGFEITGVYKYTVKSDSQPATVEPTVAVPEVAQESTTV